jgi:hypothetical protein
VNDPATNPFVKDKTQFAGGSKIAMAKALSRGMPTAAGYEIERLLGTGTFGEVWFGREKKTGIPVAIKFFKHGTGLQWQLLQAEVKQLALLHADPGIIQLIDVEPDATPPYYVMDFAEQGSLAQRLERGPLPPEQALEIFRQVTEALAYVHVKGIRHCDLKPANVLLDARGRGRVADFGQAHLSSDASPALGTFFYMAPEQADIHHTIPDARWDVYGLGSLLFAMLTGRPPREDRAVRDELDATAELSHRLERYRAWVRTAHRPDAHRRVPGVDRDLAAIIDRCLEIDPEKRYPDAQAVLAALERRVRRHRQRPLVAFGFAAPLLLFLATAALAVAAGQAAVNESERALTNQLLESDLVAARLVANAVQDQLIGKMALVAHEAASPAVRGPLHDADRAGMLRALAEIYGRYDQEQFSRWTIADRQGDIVANHPVDPSLFDRNFSWRDWYSGGGDKLDRQTEWFAPVTATYVSQPFVGRSRSGGQLIGVSTPIHDLDKPDQVIGVLLVTVKLEALHGWLRDVDMSGGFPVLVNEQRHCVEHPDPEDPKDMLMPELEANPVSWDCPTFDAAIHGPAGSTVYTDPVDQRRYLAGYAPLSHLGWGALVQHEYERATAPITALKTKTVRLAVGGFGAAGLLVSGLFGVLLWTVRRQEQSAHG